jgi:hypothetical protein
MIFCINLFGVILDGWMMTSGRSNAAAAFHGKGDFVGFLGPSNFQSCLAAK